MRVDAAFPMVRFRIPLSPFLKRPFLLPFSVFDANVDSPEQQRPCFIFRATSAAFIMADAAPMHIVTRIRNTELCVPWQSVPMNLAYMTRLGFWGFTSMSEKINMIEKGGLPSVL